MKSKTRWSLTDTKLTKVTNYFAIVVVLVLLCWGTYSLWKRWKYAYTNDAQVTQYINPITARVGGYVVSVHYRDNQFVKRGDTLVVIDNREYAFEEKEVHASIDKENVEVQVLSSQKQILNAEHESLKRAMLAHEARVHKNKLEYDRYKFLYDEGSATEEQLEEVQEALAVSESERSALQHRIEASQERVNDIEIQKEVNYAEKKRLSVAAGRKHLDVGYTVIRAPYDGMIGKRTIQNGQMVDDGEVLGFIVNAETPTWVTANFKETQLRFLHINDQVEVVVDAYPDLTFKGRIISIAPATGSSFSLLPPDNATGNFVKIVQRIPVRIELFHTADESVLRSGMNVNVSVRKQQ